EAEEARGRKLDRKGETQGRAKIRFQENRRAGHEKGSTGEDDRMPEAERKKHVAEDQRQRELPKGERTEALTGQPEQEDRDQIGPDQRAKHQQLTQLRGKAA